MRFERWYPIGGALGPLTPKRTWDQVSLGNVTIPCHHASISEGGLKLAVDKKKTLGGNGSNPTYHGIDPFPLGIDVFFTTVEQISAFYEQIVKPLGPSISVDPAKAEPVLIDAMQLRHLDAIQAVKIKHISAIMDGAPGWKKCRIVCDHWLKGPSPKSAKANATVTYAGSTGNVITDKTAAASNPKPSAQPNFAGTAHGSAGSM